MSTHRPPYRFFLGGSDLEMVTIAELARRVLGPDAVIDSGLGWGARLSDHAAALGRLPPDAVPVLVELSLDRPPPPGAIIIDHHGESAAPTSLEQVFALLRRPKVEWTRRLALVAANDRGHVRAMLAMGADPAEIAAIRAADRAAQGITPGEEETGRAALAAARREFGGRLWLVNLPHARTATVMDPLLTDPDLLAEPAPQALILCPAEVDFFGDGRAVQALHAAFPGGWRGGELPRSGFWGRGGDVPPLADLLAVLARVPPFA